MKKICGKTIYVIAIVLYCCSILTLLRWRNKLLNDCLTFTNLSHTTAPKLKNSDENLTRESLTTVFASAEKEVQHFWYIRPMKTSSMITTHELLNYCKDRELDCLTDSVHHSCKTYSSTYLSFKYKKRDAWNECAIKDKLLKSQLEYIDHFYHTSLRFQTCCDNQMPIKPSIWHHIHLGDQETRHSLFRLMAGAFKFTVLRYPIDQFVSYYNFMKRMPMSNIYSAYVPINVVTLEELVDGCIAHNSSLKRMCQLASNMQSRVLGWDGQSHKQFTNVLRLLTQLDLVCLSEYVMDCWKLLRQKLNWPHDYFDTAKLKGSSRHLVNHGLEQKIKFIQKMDMELYKYATEIFEKKFRIHI